MYPMKLLFITPLGIEGTQFIAPILLAEVSSAIDDNLIFNLGSRGMCDHFMKQILPGDLLLYSNRNTP